MNATAQNPIIELPHAIPRSLNLVKSASVTVGKEGCRSAHWIDGYRHTGTKECSDKVVTGQRTRGVFRIGYEERQQDFSCDQDQGT